MFGYIGLLGENELNLLKVFSSSSSYYLRKPEKKKKRLWFKKILLVGKNFFLANYFLYGYIKYI